MLPVHVHPCTPRLENSLRIDRSTTRASEQVSEPAMAAHLDRLGVQVVLKPFHLEDLLAAERGALTAQRLLD